MDVKFGILRCNGQFVGAESVGHDILYIQAAGIQWVHYNATIKWLAVVEYGFYNVASVHCV